MFRLDKQCGKSGIPDNKKCSKRTVPPRPSILTPRNAALGAGAVLGIAALGLAARRRFGRRDPNWKGFTSSGEDWDHIELEARRGGEKWKVFENNKKTAIAACASAKIFGYLREDVFVESPRCALGRGSYGNYVVHPSQKYGIKYLHNDKGIPDKNFRENRDSLLNEGEILQYANGEGVPTPKLYKASPNALVMEHLKDFTPLSQTPSGSASIYTLHPQAPLELKRKLLNVYETLHNAGITHNDLHFNNILINRKTREVRLIDFGIATFAHEDPELFREELKLVPDTIRLRDANKFHARWDLPLSRVELNIVRGDMDRANNLVKAYYKSLRFRLEQDYTDYTQSK